MGHLLGLATMSSMEGRLRVFTEVLKLTGRAFAYQPRHQPEAQRRVSFHALGRLCPGARRGERPQIGALRCCTARRGGT